jgi:hypothetical protein
VLHDQGADRPASDDRCRSRPAVDERDLAEEIAARELRDWLMVAHDLGGSTEKDDECLARVALPDKRLAVGKRRLGGQAGNRLDRPVGQVR